MSISKSELMRRVRSVRKKRLADALDTGSRREVWEYLFGRIVERQMHYACLYATDFTSSDKIHSFMCRNFDRLIKLSEAREKSRQQP
jgi:hypothetical protein